VVRTALLAAAVVWLPWAPSASAAPTTLYVNGADPACKDSGSGTAAVPFCSIVQAAKKATAGDTVQVAAGTYGGDIAVWNSGTAAAPITFTPAPGAAVTVSGGKRGFYLSKVSYVVVTGFATTGTTSSGLYVVNSNNVTLSGNDVSGSGQQASGLTARGIYVSGSTDVLVFGNRVHHNSESGIYLTGGSTRVRVEANELYLNARGYQRNASGVDVRAPNNVIIGNWSHDNEDSGISNYPGGDGTLVVNNVTSHNRGTSPTLGLIGDHGIDNLGVSGVRIIGNTVYDNVTAGINVEGGSIGATVANNISVDNGIGSPRTTSNIRVDANSTSGTVLDADLVFLSAGQYNIIFGSGWYRTPAELFAATGQEPTGLLADPAWVDPAGANFRLTAASPAIDSANSAVGGALGVDIEGVARVDIPSVPDTGSGPRTYDDRGAHEHH
jgi:parallel beta-helix repeat protein